MTAQLLFNKIGIMGRRHSHDCIEVIRELVEFLHQHHLQATLEQGTAEALPDIKAPTCRREELAEQDLIIVVGGDGSMLDAARAVADTQVAVLGINRGRLGFLTDISPLEFKPKLLDVLCGRYQLETRFMLEARIFDGAQQLASGSALNDVVLNSGDFARMIEFEVFINQQFVYSQRSDGLIVATPTGSTAYALSAGGPILQAELDTVVLVPMHPHTLSSRPIVIDAASNIEIHLASNLKIPPGISLDGQAPLTVPAGGVIKINKKPRRLRLIHPLDHNYFQVLRTKLQWGSQLD